MNTKITIKQIPVRELKVGDVIVTGSGVDIEMNKVKSKNESIITTSWGRFIYIPTDEVWILDV